VNPRSALRWKIVLGVFMMFGAYCAASGRVGLWPGGYYAAFSLVTLGIGYSISVRVAPDLIVNRVSWAADVKRWDKPIVFCFMFGPVVTCLVAGFEARENGPGVRPALQVRNCAGYSVRDRAGQASKARAASSMNWVSIRVSAVTLSGILLK